MNDAVDRVIVEREAMDRGFPAALILSLSAHALLVGGAFAATLLGAREPVLKVADGIAVALPPGGGGPPSVEPPAPAPAQPEPAPPVTAPSKPEPPPKIQKPPKEERRKGPPEPDARRSKKQKTEKSPPPQPAGGSSTQPGTAQIGGIAFGPAGPGVPGGTDPMGDWYMAGVVRKIGLIWHQQIRAGHTQAVVVELTILADGSVDDIRVVQSSGVVLLDLAAHRAISSAAPFAPLPRAYDTDRHTIQLRFLPSN